MRGQLRGQAGACKEIGKNPPGPSQTRRTNPCCGPQVDEETVVMEVTKQDITGPRRDTDVTGSESFLGVSGRMNREEWVPN